MIEPPTADWVARLHLEMAAATELVWKIQNALTEAGDLTPEIVDLARRLEYRAGVVRGFVARWEGLKAATREGLKPGE